jgi:hypothetical protein
LLLLLYFLYVFFIFWKINNIVDNVVNNIRGEFIYWTRIYGHVTRMNERMNEWMNGICRLCINTKKINFIFLHF